MRITDTSDLWWKTAVIYCLDVEKFVDSDGDGVGVDVDGRTGVHLLEVRPPEGAASVSPLETDPETLRRACMVGREALRSVLESDDDPVPA